MTFKQMFKIRVPFFLALLIIVVLAASVEQIFLQAEKISNRASNLLAVSSSAAEQQVFAFWQSNFGDKVALAEANVPLIPGAKRLTFDSGEAVSYRLNVSANKVASFYRWILAEQGWKIASAAEMDGKLEHLSIIYAGNPLSKKTDVTYAYAPAQAKVLGVKVAEADLSQPALAEQPLQPLPPAGDGQNIAPAPQQPIQPNYQQPMSGDQNQPQPMNQPIMNQMDFTRQPLQNNSAGQGAGQTCRVNGVDLPGSCEQYNNQGTNQPGQPNQMNQGGNQGPSEEEMKKMDERRFKDTKKGLTQFANQVKSMKKSFTRVKASISKCGVGLPEDLNNALSQAGSLIAKVNAAKTADELDEIIGDVQDVGSVMQDWGPRMGDLNRLCQMMKQADRDAKQFDRNVKRVETQAKSNKKIDLSELIAEYKTAVAEQKQALAEAKELAKTDPESALEKIEDDFYGNMDNLGNLQMQIDALFNVSKGIKDATREITTFTSQLKSLAKKKVDVAEQQSLLNDFKAQMNEVKNLMNSKADAEELIAKVEEAFDTRQNLQDGLQELGVLKNMPQVSSGSNYNVKVNIPGAFKKTEPADNCGEPGANQPGL